MTDPSAPAVIEMVDVALTPKRYPKQGLEASFPASGIPPRLDFQHGYPKPSLSLSVEARPCDLYPYTGKGSSTSFILSAHQSLGHEWYNILKAPVN